MPEQQGDHTPGSTPGRRDAGAGWHAVAQGWLVREQWLFRSSIQWSDVAYHRGLLAAWSPVRPGGLDQFLERLRGGDPREGAAPIRRTAFDACRPCIERLVEVNCGLRLQVPAYFLLSRLRLQGMVALTSPRPSHGSDAQAPLEAAIALEHEAVTGRHPKAVVAAARGRLLFYGVEGVLTREEQVVAGSARGKAAVKAARKTANEIVIRQALRRAGIPDPMVTQISETIPEADVTLGLLVLAARPDPDLVVQCAKARADAVTALAPAAAAGD